MTALEYLAQHKKEHLEELFALLRFPSVSAKPEHKKDVNACAEWLRAHIAERLQIKAELHPTKGNPIVYAEYLNAPAGAPTVLYYGHYDVQPPEPFELWETPPFDPQIRGEYMYARGATDDKGQTFAHIKGLEALKKTDGGYPINFKLFIEGEEEVGSKNLEDYMKANKERLKADIAVVSDTAQFDKKTPAVTFGLRGLAYVEVQVDGPSHDVHSGGFGGAIANPVNVLCWMVGQLHDKNGKVAVPGFYQHVKNASKWERDQFKKLPYNEAKYKKSLGIPALQGEKGFTTYERTWIRPTLDVNGITGGYQGEGPKTIIPAKATCKITMRLVPDMNPKDIMNKVEKYLKKIAPKSVKLTVRKVDGSPAVTVPTDGPWLEAAAAAIKTGFGKQPVFMKEGGSIPVVGSFKRMLGIDTLLIGFGQHDDRIHSPNERFRLVDFENGCKTAAALPGELAKVSLKKK